MSGRPDQASSNHNGRNEGHSEGGIAGIALWTISVEVRRLVCCWPRSTWSALFPVSGHEVDHVLPPTLWALLPGLPRRSKGACAGAALADVDGRAYRDLVVELDDVRYGHADAAVGGGAAERC